MKRIAAGRTLPGAQLCVLWFALGQVATHSPAQTGLRAGAETLPPLVRVSPSALDFGLVGVGRTKDLTLTVYNAGGGILKGRATAPRPFRLSGGKYSLKAGESKSLTVRYQPSTVGTNTAAIVLSGGTPVQVALNGWARVPPKPPQKLRVVTPEDVRQADFIVRYNDERTSHVLKPRMIETFGEREFLAIFEREGVQKLAAAQPRRERAIIVLSKLALYFSFSGNVSGPEDDAWFRKLGALVATLEKLGYGQLIFCTGDPDNERELKGLPVVGIPQLGAAPSGG